MKTNFEGIYKGEKMFSSFRMNWSIEAFGVYLEYFQIFWLRLVELPNPLPPLCRIFYQK